MKIILAIGIFVCVGHPTFGQIGNSSSDSVVATFKTPDHRVRDVAFSPGGQLLAAGYGYSDEGGVTIWNVSDQSVVATLFAGKDTAGISRIDFSPDGKRFAAANDKGDVVLWTVGEWRTNKTVLKGKGSATDLSFSQSYLGFTSQDSALLYDLETGKVTTLGSKANAGDSFEGISFTPDGKVVAVCGRREIWLYDLENQTRIATFKLNSFSFFGKLSKDGNYLIAGGGPVFGKKSVQIWNVKEKKRIGELTEFRGGVFSLAISHSGKLFAIAGGDYDENGDLSLWSLEDSRELAFTEFGKFPFKGLAFSPEDALLAAGSEDGFVVLYAVDRLRGSVLKKQKTPLCGEIAIEGGRTWIRSLAKVPLPMRDFQYPWQLQISNAEGVVSLAGSPIVLSDWSIESTAGTDRVRINEFYPLLGNPLMKSSDHILFGYTQNPGWNDSFIAKIYQDGSFVASDNAGKCRSYGSLGQLKTDFDSVRSRLVNRGLVNLAKEPLVLGTDHYGTAFIELSFNEVTELRSDADDIQALLKGGTAKKRKAFAQVYTQEQEFIDLLLRAGMKLP